MSELQIIEVYSTKNAVDDGALVSLPNHLIKEANIRFPVYVTREIFDRYIQDENNAIEGDPNGRVWDILSVFKYAAKNNTSNFARFSVAFQFKKNLTWQPNEKRNTDLANGRDAEFLAKIAPEDHDKPNPAIFIYQEWED